MPSGTIPGELAARNFGISIIILAIFIAISGGIAAGAVVFIISIVLVRIFHSIIQGYYGRERRLFQERLEGYENRKQQWLSRVRENWNDLSYCSRCDGVFLRGRFVRSDQMINLITQV